MTTRIISNLFRSNNVRNTIDEILEVYKSDDKPWVIGYSGGKDSTVVVQLIFEALSELPKDELHKKVYIISSDTLVETPLIIQSINQTLMNIQEEALMRELPIETHKVKPFINQSFWVNLIGRGYPSPNQTFRWCTDRLKIDPANEFIKEKIDSFGEVIMVLGVREEESATRANVIRSHSVEGKTLMKHSTLTNAFVYAPIKKFTLDDVWEYLLTNPSPWGDDNHELHRLYKDSNSGECPLVIDKTIKESAGSCGNSRFGCWVCTVVTEDKAITGFIRSGHDWMKPLLDFRNWLASIRDNRSFRMKYRMNGQIYFNKVDVKEIDGKQKIIVTKKGAREKNEIPLHDFKSVPINNLNNFIEKNNIDLSKGSDDFLIILEDGSYAQLGLGAFTFEARKTILEKLLKTQKKIIHPKDPNYELITEEELKEIRRIWLQNGIWEDIIPNMFYKIFGYQIDWETDDRPIFNEEDIFHLENLCNKYNVDIKVVKKLISIEKEFSGYKIQRGITKEIEKVLNQDYLHL